MAERLFAFLQADLPRLARIPDGRWLVREQGSEAVRQIVVLMTFDAVGAAARPEKQSRRRQTRASTPHPEQGAPLLLATVISAVPYEDEPSAKRWLQALDEEHETDAAFAALNRVLRAYRLAAADPYTHEIRPRDALALRAGYGHGELVAEGRSVAVRAFDPARPKGRRRRRAAMLSPQERTARLLAHPEEALLCEELALRARADLDQGRLPHAAGELDRALAAATGELGGHAFLRLESRLEELRELHPMVSRIASEWMSGRSAAPDEEVAQTLDHALARLEAMLRARALELSLR